MFAFSIRPDLRRFANAEEGRTTCRRCGVRLYLLPDDRRLGFCFDCYDPSKIREATY